MDLHSVGQSWRVISDQPGEFVLEKCKCQRTNIVARSVAICSSTLNISLNTRAPIHLARSAQARRVSTYQRHLSPRRQKRAEISARFNSSVERMIDCRRGFVASARGYPRGRSDHQKFSAPDSGACCRTSSSESGTASPRRRRARRDRTADIAHGLFRLRPYQARRPGRPFWGPSPCRRLS
jgi:hypothetical protein